MDTRWPVPTIGKGTHSVIPFPYSYPYSVTQGWGQSISTPGTMRLWDTRTGTVINDIDIDDLGEIAFSGTKRTIVFVMGRGFCTYNGWTRMRLCEGKFPPPYNHQLGAQWAHYESLQFARSSRFDGKPVVGIFELQQTSNPLLTMIASFPVSPHDGEFSFSPASSHASFVTKTEVVILNVQDSEILFQSRTPHPLYTPPGHFSLDGCFFACGTLENNICVWKYTSTGYVPWSNLTPQSPFTGFAFSPVATTILSWGSEGFELLHPDGSAGGTHATTVPQEDSVVSRRTIIDPGQTYFYS